MGQLLVTHEMIIAAAGELDLAADRLAAILTAASPETHVIPSGSDAVSTTIAGQMNIAASTHHTSSWPGVEYMHRAADTLRKHAAEFAAGDAIHAAEVAAAGILNI